MTSVTSASAITNYADQYGAGHAPQNNHSYNRNHGRRSFVHSSENVYPSSPSTTPTTSVKRGPPHANEASLGTQRRATKSGVATHSTNSMKDTPRLEPCQSARGPRRREPETEEKYAEVTNRVQENDSGSLSFAPRRRSNQENRRPRDGSVSGRRSRNTSPSGDDRISTASSSRRRSSGSRNPEGGNRRSSKHYDPNSEEVASMEVTARQYDSNVGESSRSVRSSRPYDPEAGDPPGQIRPSRRYDSSGHRQEQGRPSRHYENTPEQYRREARTDYARRDQAEEPRRSSRPSEPHRDPPGQIRSRRSSMNMDSESSAHDQRRPSARETSSYDQQESEMSSRRHSLCRSDSTGGESRDTRRYQRRKARGSEEREGAQTESAGDPYREVRRSQSRHSNMRRSVSRSSSVDKSSDVETDFRTRDRKASAARVRDRGNDDEANYQEQMRNRARTRDLGPQSQVNTPSGEVDASEYKNRQETRHSRRPESNKADDSCRYSRHEGEQGREKVRNTHYEDHQQRRRSGSIANEEPEYESPDSRRQSSSLRGRQGTAMVEAETMSKRSSGVMKSSRKSTQQDAVTADLRKLN